MLLSSHFPVTTELFEILSVLSITVLWYWFWVLWWVTLTRFWVCASGVNSKCTYCCALAIQTTVDVKSSSPLSSCVGKDLLGMFSTWVSLVLGFLVFFQCQYLHANTAIEAHIVTCSGQWFAFPEAAPLNNCHK